MLKERNQKSIGHSEFDSSLRDIKEEGEDGFYQKDLRVELCFRRFIANPLWHPQA